MHCGGIIHAVGVAVVVVRGPSSIIHAVGVRFGFSSSAPKGRIVRWGDRPYRMGVIRLSFWRRYRK
jgi:hypothetical protein